MCRQQSILEACEILSSCYFICILDYLGIIRSNGMLRLCEELGGMEVSKEQNKYTNIPISLETL
jgi:hypothetical protein